MSRLDNIQAQLDAATPGPWILRDCSPCTDRGRMDVFIWGADRDSLIAHWCDDDPLDRPDAEFIAAAPENTRYLLNLITAVKALHRSKALPYTLPKDQTCIHCGHPWPCPTTRALDGAA